MRGTLAFTGIATVAGTALAASPIPAHRAGNPMRCPTATMATKGGNRPLRERAEVHAYNTAKGLRAVAIAGGGITRLEREGPVAASDGNNCGLGVPVRTVRAGKDTRATLGSDDPSTSRSSAAATRRRHAGRTRRQNRRDRLA